LKNLWSDLIHIPARDLVVAAVCALVFAIAVDLLRVGSRIRDFARFIGNKLSEQSIAQLQNRIKQLEKYRDSLALMMSSDKAHYLGTFRLILGILLCMCIGMGLFVTGHFLSPMLSPATPDASTAVHLMDLLAILMFSIAMAIASQGLTVASWDTRPKVAEQIQKHDAEIANLKAILASRLQKLKA
jgi:hypothetical protein